MPLNENGQFVSDKHPDLPPDRIRLNFNNPNSWRALWLLAEDYADVDPQLAADIASRLRRAQRDQLNMCRYVTTVVTDAYAPGGPQEVEERIRETLHTHPRLSLRTESVSTELAPGKAEAKARGDSDLVSRTETLDWARD